jgi:hypothetical protein
MVSLPPIDAIYFRDDGRVPSGKVMTVYVPHGTFDGEAQRIVAALQPVWPDVVIQVCEPGSGQRQII